MEKKVGFEMGLEKERNELDERLTDLQEKYKKAQEELELAESRENKGEEERNTLLRKKCLELETELKSKNIQVESQGTSIRSKDEMIVKLENSIRDIKLKRLNEASVYGKKLTQMQKTLDDTKTECSNLQKTLDEKDRECTNIAAGRNAMMKNFLQSPGGSLICLRQVLAKIWKAIMPKSVVKRNEV